MEAPPNPQPAPLRRIPREETDRVRNGHEVHVWTVKVAEWLPALHDLANTLNLVERERAARFRFETDRSRFTLCRGLLRTLLGQYLEIDPNAVEFQYGSHDKPQLASSMPFALEFNLSHSDQAAIFAFATRRVGIDVERVRSQIDALGLAHQAFTPLEIEALSAAAEGQRESLFFTIWTRKEAYIKAVGLGLSAPVREMTVGPGPAPGEPDAGTHLEGYGAHWSLLGLPSDEKYKAAIAIEGHLEPAGLQVRALRPIG